MLSLLILVSASVLFSAQFSMQAQAAGAADAYAAIFDAAFYAAKYPDLKAVYGTDETALLTHFLTKGMAEGRQGNADFDVHYYMSAYPDLKAVFGNQLTLYYTHYMSAGKAEGRLGHAAAAAPQPAATVTASNTAVSTGDSYTDQVISLVNQERAKAGLSPLSKDTALSAAAQARSREMVYKQSHTRPDGSSCFTIFAEYGIGYHWAGENVAAGQKNPAEVVNAWMNSPGHRANILNGNFGRIGVGCVQDSNSYYKYYWVQMFTD